MLASEREKGREGEGEGERSTDPTSRIFLKHYATNYKEGTAGELASLILNIMFARNTMSKEVVKLSAMGRLPWLSCESGRVAPESKKALNKMYMSLGGRVFYKHVEPMRNRSKAPRRGWGELVSELVGFARKAPELATILLFDSDHAVERLAMEIRKVSGFGGKGFRMKEIILDLVEVTRAQFPGLESQLLDFGVVGPGPRRALNFVNNRRWFDNEQDRSPAAEEMYVGELRDFRDYLMASTDIIQLQTLNLLGVQFALCEAARYIFYLRYEAGPLYKPRSQDFGLVLREDGSEADLARLRAIWRSWEDEEEVETAELEDDVHPDQLALTSLS